MIAWKRWTIVAAFAACAAAARLLAASPAEPGDPPAPEELRKEAAQMRDLAGMLGSRGKSDVAAQLREDAEALVRRAEALETWGLAVPAGPASGPPPATGLRPLWPIAPDRQIAPPVADIGPELDSQPVAEPAREAAEQVRAAAATLRAAGMFGHAQKLERQARRIERKAAGPPGNEPLLRAVDDLRREVAALRGDVRRLAAQVPDGPSRLGPQDRAASSPERSGPAIPEGLHLFSLAVDPGEAASLRPGDRVDVLVVDRPAHPDNKPAEARWLVEDVEVYAVASEGESGAGRSMAGLGRVVLLAVTAEQAQRLARGSASGTIRLAATSGR